MSRSQGAATAIIDAPRLGGAIVTTHARVLGAPAEEPAIGDRRDSRLLGFMGGRARDSARSGSARSAARFKPRASSGPARAAVRFGSGCVTAR